MKDRTYTTTRGVTVRFRPILADLEQFHATHPDLVPPTYDVPTVTGLVEKWPLTQEFIDTDDAKPEEKAAWAEYLVEQGKVSEKQSRDLIKLCLIKGVEFDAPQSLDDWKAEQAFLGASVPDGAIEQRFAYAYSILVGTVEDVLEIIKGVSLASGEIPQELRAQAESTFQRPMERADGQTITGLAHQEGQVVTQSTLGTGVDSRADGDNHKRIRRAR